MDLKDRLRILREEIGLTQKELAEKMNIAKTTYNNYETGKREPDKETLKRFAAFFDCSIDYLLGFSDIRNPYKNNNTANHKGNDCDEQLTEEELFAVNQFKEFLKYQRKKNTKNKDKS